MSVLRTPVRWGVAALALGFLVAYAARNWQDLQREDLTVDWAVMALSFALLLVYMGGRVLAWHQITVHLGVGIPVRAASASWLLSLLGKYLPGKVFLLLGRLELYSAHGRSKVQTTVGFTIETIVSMLSSVYVILLALVFVEIDLIQRLRIPLLLALVGLTLSLHPKVLQSVLGVAGRLTKREMPTISVSFRQMLLFVGVGTGVWLIFGLAFYLFINALYDVDIVYLLYLAGAISAASLIGILAVIAPSGLGVREGFLTLLLAQVMPAPLAAVVSLASRVWVTAGELLAIALGAWLSRQVKRGLAALGPGSHPVPSPAGGASTSAPDRNSA